MKTFSIWSSFRGTDSLFITLRSTLGIAYSMGFIRLIGLIGFIGFIGCIELIGFTLRAKSALSVAKITVTSALSVGSNWLKPTRIIAALQLGRSLLMSHFKNSTAWKLELVAKCAFHRHQIAAIILAVIILNAIFSWCCR